MPQLHITSVDPLCEDALTLLREAAVEARALYPELFDADAPWPTNAPTPARGVYLIAYENDHAVACGAIRPLDAKTAEVRRVFVTTSARRRGVAARVMEALETRAVSLGFTRLLLETGNRQAAAMALYESLGFQRIPPFGEYVGDPTSVCFEKRIGPLAPQ